MQRERLDDEVVACFGDQSGRTFSSSEITSRPSPTQIKAKKAVQKEYHIAFIVWYNTIEPDNRFTMKIDVSLAKSAGLDTTRFPQTNQEVELAEQAIADALAKLSLDDHEKILLDVHGCRVSDDSALNDAPSSAEISCSSNDDSSATNSHRDPKESLLQQLDQELHRINTDKEAYKMAMDNSKDPTFYGKSRWFRLAFLRAEQDDASKAAAAIVAHFTVKRQLFGDSSLPRHVRFSDLSAKAEEILCSGIFQVLPVPDAAGRLIMTCNPSLFQLHEDWSKDDPRNSVSVVSGGVVRLQRRTYQG